MNRSAVPSVAALAAGALLLGGCTLGAADEAPATDAAPAPSSGGAPSSEGVGDTVEVLLASAGQETVDLTGDLPVLATRAAANTNGEYEIDLNGVAVREGLMTVVFTLRVQSMTRSVFSVNSMFDDGRFADGEGVVDPSGTSTDGVYVLDPAEATRHLTAYDSENRCVCSDALTGTSLVEGGTVVLSSTMAAPPDSTTTVDVVIPTVGVFTDVTLER